MNPSSHGCRIIQSLLSSNSKYCFFADSCNILWTSMEIHATLYNPPLKIHATFSQNAFSLPLQVYMAISHNHMILLWHVWTKNYHTHIRVIKTTVTVSLLTFSWATSDSVSEMQSTYLFLHLHARIREYHLSQELGEQGLNSTQSIVFFQKNIQKVAIENSWIEVYVCTVLLNTGHLWKMNRIKALGLNSIGFQHRKNIFCLK